MGQKNEVLLKFINSAKFPEISLINFFKNEFSFKFCHATEQETVLLFILIPKNTHPTLPTL
jgi:hypothetical protein